MAEAFGGSNPFNIFEDIWYGDNRHNTGWTMQKLRVIGIYYEDSKRKTEISPEGFIVQKRPFSKEWDIAEEEKNG